MKLIRLAAAVLALALPGLAQYTTEQKLNEFRFLAAVLDKNYAPYEWKRQLFGFDMMDIRPWLERVANSKTDLDFLEICSEYLAGLHDTGVFFQIPSTFRASLGLQVDLLDGKPLIVAVDRGLLPAARFPLQTGDEILSIDGKPADALMAQFSRYVSTGNPRATRRQAAQLLAERPQALMPRAAVEIGENAELTVRHADGSTAAFSLPWRKTGAPFAAGPVPSPRMVARRAVPRDEDPPNAADEPGLNLDPRAPLFALPQGFAQRLGTVPGDQFFSGTYQAGGRTIGLLRIWNFSSSSGLQQFDQEIAWLQQNTDALVVDTTLSFTYGASICYVENLAGRFARGLYQVPGYEIRATQAWVTFFANQVNSARAQGLPSWIVNGWQASLEQVQQAAGENRGRSGPVPLCWPSLVRPAPAVTYTRPVLVLTDDYSIDLFPAIMQDNALGTVFGMRSLGAGGASALMAGGPMPVQFGAYTESVMGFTTALMTRKAPVVTPDLPTTYYVENVGVQPDIPYDFMTRENLMTRGKPFVDAFTAAILNAVK